MDLLAVLLLVASSAAFYGIWRTDPTGRISEIGRPRSLFVSIETLFGGLTLTVVLPTHMWVATPLFMWAMVAAAIFLMSPARTAGTECRDEPGACSTRRSA